MSDEWQKGIPLERLRAFAAPFKARHKSLVHGAFGLTKERDVAEALDRKRAIWTGDPPQAVALFSVSKQGSEQSDFTGRTFHIPPGSVIVKAFAAFSVEAGTKVLTVLADRAARSLVVEIFEEDDIAKQCVAKVKLPYQLTKISAGSEIKGIYSHQSLAEPLEAAELATLEVIKAYLSSKELEQVRAELSAYGDRFAQHYSSYNKRHSWTAFALTGFKPDDPQFIELPEEMSKSWKEENSHMLGLPCVPTLAAKSFPKAMAVVDRIPGRKERVRFMRLRAKIGELSRHADITDRNAGVADGRTVRFHIPIYTSDAVTFHAWDERGRQMTKKLPVGSLCYLDRRKPHKVTNEDPSLDRVHLVIDAASGPQTRKWIVEAMEKSGGVSALRSVA